MSRPSPICKRLGLSYHPDPFAHLSGDTLTDALRQPRQASPQTFGRILAHNMRQAEAGFTSLQRRPSWKPAIILTIIVLIIATIYLLH